MEQFVVSARKYRPATFDSVVGQQSITNTLKNAIKTGHLAQAFLFCGSRGVGKTTCARILAKTINCTNRSENIEACDQCDSCKSFNEGASLNIQELDAASNNSVDDIRNLNDQVRFAPQIGTHKVYIIDEVHMLSTAAFNAFLKTLEEPPAHAIFILATTEKHKIIPTILSRCQIFDFNRIGVEDISNHLASIADKEGVEAEHEGLHLIAQKADGALRDALSMFDQLVSFSDNHLSYESVIKNLNILDYDYYFKCTQLVLEHKISEALLLFNEVLSHGFDGHHFINGLAEHLRNLLVCQDEQTVKLLEVGPSIKDRYLEQATNCSVRFIYQALEICRQVDVQYKSSQNQRLLVELALMQLASIDTELSTAEKKKPKIISHLLTAEHSKTGDQKEKIEASSSSIADQENDATPNPVAAPSISNERSAPEEKIEKAEVAEEKSAQRAEFANAKKKAASKLARSRSLSINQLTKTIEEQEAKQLNKAYTSDARDHFSEAELKSTWKSLAENIKEEGKEGSSIVYAAMSTHEPVLEDNYKVNLPVDNKSQFEEMSLARTEIHDFLRKQLNNGGIEVSFQVNKDQSKKKAYTPEEKFQKLAEKNPVLLKLKKELDLDFF